MPLQPDEASPVIPILSGPTGVGKTALSLELAATLDGEIVNADSRQVYRGMDIGTAKPSPAERQGVPHHLFDILDISERITVGKYLKLAEHVFEDILSRGKTPIVVGGSTLYTYALTHGLADIPDVDPTIRVQLEKRAEEVGIHTLYGELASVDPVSADSMDPTKSQRILRALEVYVGTGKTLSSFFDSSARLPHRFAMFVFNRDREELYARIDQRVDKMILDGLVDEVQTLRNGGVNDNLYALRSPGYREVIAYSNQVVPYEEMIRLIKRNTRRYAKRQLTWFRRYAEKFWMERASADIDAIMSNIDSHIV